MSQNHRTSEGVIAGFIGASAIAVWFFVVDTIQGTPLRTPLLLAHGVLAVFKADPGDAIGWPVLMYTAIHYAAFIGVGVVSSRMLEASKRTPALLAGLFLMFATFELGFYWFCVMLSMLTNIGMLAWYQIAAANILAAATMGTYLWRHHPEATHALDAALRGVTP